MARKCTTMRWRALNWFANHEADQHSVMGQRVPTAKMRNRMVREGQLLRVPVGQFDFHRFILTHAGRELLATKGKHTANAQAQNTAAPESGSDDTVGA